MAEEYSLVNLSLYSDLDLDTSNRSEKNANEAASAVQEVMTVKSSVKMTLIGAKRSAQLINKYNEKFTVATNIKSLKKETKTRFEKKFILMCKCGELCDDNNYCMKKEKRKFHRCDTIRTTNQIST